MPEKVTVAQQLGDDPRFGSNALRLAHSAEVEDLVPRALARSTFGEVAAALDAADVPWGRFNDVAGVLAHPQLADPDRWVSVRLPGGDKTRVLDDPFLSGRTFRATAFWPCPGWAGTPARSCGSWVTPTTASIVSCGMGS
jgi:crotonobetainyl-CoA:carnitine CoA-transferase CaiB-like acyl-CoA transferase